MYIYLFTVVVDGSEDQQSLYFRFNDIFFEIYLPFFRVSCAIYHY